MPGNLKGRRRGWVRAPVTAAVTILAGTVACGGDPPEEATVARVTVTTSPAVTATAGTELLPPVTATAPPTTTAPAPPVTAGPGPRTRSYPWRRGITATTFWVGELHDGSASDGSQVCSTYDARWAYHWSGVATGAVPEHAPGCPGSPTGGCDGVIRSGRCVTERRDASNDFFPREVTVRENPFYVDVPYDDLNDPTGFARRCEVVPWADDPGYAGRCRDRSFSYLKNRWLAIVGPNGRTCYGQVQDAGPARYDDAAYVFGPGDARPASMEYDNAGLEVSPALNGCLGFGELDGSSDRVDWRFVEEVDVPPGPWRKVITRTPVHNG